MAPTIRTYQGKRPSIKPSCSRPIPTSDPFDQLVFGQRRSPHPFSSSGEDIRTPSADSLFESPMSPRFLSAEYHAMKGTLNSVRRDALAKSKWRKTPFVLAKVQNEYRLVFNKRQKSSPLRKKTPKLLRSDVLAASTPIRRVSGKRMRGKRVRDTKAGQPSCFLKDVLTPNLEKSNETEAVLPLGSPDVSFISCSPFTKKCRLPVLETPKSVGIPPKNPIDSVTNKMLLMNLAGASVPRERNPSRISSAIVLGESVCPDPHPTVNQSQLQAEASSAFLGFSSNASTPSFVRPTCKSPQHQPSPDFITRRRPRTKLGEATPPRAWSKSTVSNDDSNLETSPSATSSHVDESIHLRLDESDETPTPSTTSDNSIDSVIRRRNLQRATDHVTNVSVVSPDGCDSQDSILEPNPTDKRLSREDSGGIESSSELLPSRSSRGGNLPEDAAKRRQLLKTMEPTKRDSGDIASPESSHSGVDSSNESALEEVGIFHPKRLSGLKEGSSSGTSSDDFCSMDSVPSSPERACRNLSMRSMDRSNFRRKPFNELVPSTRGSLRDDLMSSSEDENEDDGYGDISSRSSESYPFYEPSLLEPLHENVERLDDEDENSSLSSESSAKKSPVDSLESSRTPNMRRKASRHNEERSPTGRSSIGRASIIPDLVSVIEEDSISSDSVAPLEQVPLEHFVLQPGKKYRRSLLIIQNVEDISETHTRKGRRYSCVVEEVLRLQTSQCETQVETPVQLIRKRISLRRSSWIKQITPPPRRRLTLLPKTPDRSVGTSETPPSLRLPLLKTTRSQLADRSLPRPPVQDNDRSTLESERDRILKVCNQSQITSFNDILPQESYDDCVKLGEGVYGEVFSIKRKDRKTVLKIIPVEGAQRVNDADQKTYQEIGPELVIAKQLHDLRFGASNGANKASGFAEIVNVNLVQGCYPTQLLKCWDDFNEVKGSENDRPLSDSSQQYVIIEQGNGGTALEEYVFQSANTALSVFKQIVFSLAVAESAYSFEHRDLHWGNVLISRTTERKLSYSMNSREVTIAANGVKGTIIDYTLSRMDTELGPIFNDLSKDPELFLGSGDLQFDVYRHMKKDVNNDWSQFKPRTNARWLSYILDKLLKKKYSRKTAKVHKDSLKVLMDIESWIEECNSSLEVAAKLVEM